MKKMKRKPPFHLRNGGFRFYFVVRQSAIISAEDYTEIRGFTAFGNE
ncbi:MULTISPECIES: hypothetical protein [Peribacillus]|nr:MULTISPECIES: hypothetical protein [Peribacillus]MCT4476121.1 hypothetical protein [Peribacillus frigoritolerans]